LTAADIRWLNKQVGFAIMTIFLRNNAVLFSSTDERILQEIEEVIRQLDTPTPQVLIECRILGVTLTDDFSSFFEVSGLEYSQKGGGDDNAKIWSGSLFGATGTSAGVLYNLVNDKWKLDLKLELLQKDGLVNTISTPMIVAAQNTEAEITSGDANVPMFSGINVNPPSYDDEGNMTTQGYTSPEYSTADLVGTRLRITPQVNEDRSVTLRINLQQSGFSSNGAEIQYTTFDSNGNPNANWSTSTVRTLKSNTLQTIAVVPEGLTLALGGLIEEEENVNERKVPILGDIPLIGFFFKNEVKTKHRTEMIFLLTPHILMVPTEAGRVTAETLEGTEHPATKQGTRYMLRYNEDRKELQKVR
jgi:general secretion pathway protein D